MNNLHLDNWADRLIREYEIGRSELSQKKNEMAAKSVLNQSDKGQINSMINGMGETIQWMTTGRDPNSFGGNEKRGVYQRQAFANMDMFPSLDIVPEESPLENDDKQAIFNILINLSPRERQCYILHKAYMMSYADVSKELKLGRSTVQKYVERAKNKISCRANVVQSH